MGDKNWVLYIIRIASYPRPNYQEYARGGVRAIIGLMLTAASSTLLAFEMAALAELRDFFPTAPEWLLVTISILVSVSAVGGVEGYIVATGMQAGLGKRLDEVGRERGVAAIVLLFVSIVAALYQRSFLTNNESFQEFVSYTLSFVSAIGIPVAILLAAPYLGVMMSLQQNAEKDWLTKARDDFKNSRERRLAQRDLLAMSKRNISSNSPSTASERAPEPEKPEAVEIIHWYLKKTGMGLESASLSSAEIARAFAQEQGWALDPDQMSKFGTAIRTALSRERQRQGVIIVRGSTNGNGNRSN